MRILVFYLAMLATVSLLGSGCSIKKEVKSKKITLRYGNFEGSPAQISLNKTVVDEFNKRHTDIEVKYERAENYDKILVQMAGGTAPDVFYYCGVDALVAKGAIIDLMPFINKNKEVNIKDYFSPVVDFFKCGEGLYAFPLHFGASALIYNKALFDKSSLKYPDETWTWTDFFKAAKVLTKDTDNDSRIDQFGTTRPDTWFMIQSFGGEVIESDGRCVIDSPESRDALQFLLNLERDGIIPSTVQLEQGGWGELALFSRGKLGMFIISAFMLPSLKDIKAFEWDVAPLPKREGKMRVTSFGSGGLCISSQSKHPKETFQFVKFYCGEPGQKILSKGRNCIPALKSIAYSPEYFCSSPPEHIKVFVDAIEDGRTWPRVLWFDEFRRTVFVPQTDLFFLGRQTLEGTIKAITDGANRFLENR